jgi:SAM-dependent methyltransferase
MDDWIQNVITKLKLFLPPKSEILEVGCGNGLIYSSLINDIDKYTGVDNAKFAIQCIANSRIGREFHNKTNLFEMSADQIYLLNDKFDCIILNSVAQYFPSISYMLDFIKSCLSLLKPNGFIYLGDIRSLELAEDFYNDVANFRFPNETTERTIFKENLIKNEKETLYSKSFFYSLKKIFTELEYILCSDKNSVFRNEMSLYRYDVILHTELQNQYEAPILNKFQVDKFSNRLGFISERILLNEIEYEIFIVSNIFIQLIKSL